MTITDDPPTAPAGATASRPPEATSSPHAPASDGPGAASDTQKRKTIKTSDPAPGRGARTIRAALPAVAAVGGLTVGAIGFAMSFTALSHVAVHWGFSTLLAPWLPVGVDASIVVFLALDLYLIMRETPWPLLRSAAYAMTGATIYFNASSQGPLTEDLARTASHAIMPTLFVVGVEAARKLIVKAAKIKAGTVTDRIPVHRWLLAPLATPRLYRRMRLHNVTSYEEMIIRQQDRAGYEQWLKRKYGGDLSKASEDEKLPLTMAAHGYTVAQALALPDQQDRAAEQREEEAERRRLEAETRKVVAQQHAAAEQLRAEGELEALRARVAGETAQARTEAQARQAAAERAAQAEADANSAADVAEAQAREAEAARREAEERQRAAEADREAAEAEKAASEARAKAAREAFDAKRREANAAALSAQAAEARRRAAEAAEAEAAARRRAAELGLRAAEAEDIERMSPRQRGVRKVARMIHAAGGDVANLPLAQIQDALNLAQPTASEYRTEAAQLLKAGYQQELEQALAA